MARDLGRWARLQPGGVAVLPGQRLADGRQPGGGPFREGGHPPLHRSQRRRAFLAAAGNHLRPTATQFQLRRKDSLNDANQIVAKREEKAGQATGCAPTDLAAPALDPNPPGACQVLGLAPVAAMTGHAPHCPAVGALFRPGALLIPFIFDVSLYIQGKGDYNQAALFGFRPVRVTSRWSDLGHLGRKAFLLLGVDRQAYWLFPSLRRKKPLSLEWPWGLEEPTPPFISAEMPCFQLFILAANSTRSVRLCSKTLSRCGLITPPSQSRVDTMIARAIQTEPPCTLTLISSACTCCKSRD